MRQRESDTTQHGGEIKNSSTLVTNFHEYTKIDSDAKAPKGGPGFPKQPSQARVALAISPYFNVQPGKPKPECKINFPEFNVNKLELEHFSRDILFKEFLILDGTWQFEHHLLCLSLSYEEKTEKKEFKIIKEMAIKQANEDQMRWNNYSKEAVEQIFKFQKSMQFSVEGKKYGPVFTFAEARNIKECKNLRNDIFKAITSNKYAQLTHDFNELLEYKLTRNNYNVLMQRCKNGELHYTIKEEKKMESYIKQLLSINLAWELAMFALVAKYASPIHGLLYRGGGNRDKTADLANKVLRSIMKDFTEHPFALQYIRYHCRTVKLDLSGTKKSRLSEENDNSGNTDSSPDSSPILKASKNSFLTAFEEKENLNNGMIKVDVDEMNAMLLTLSDPGAKGETRKAMLKFGKKKYPDLFLEKCIPESPRMGRRYDIWDSNRNIIMAGAATVGVVAAASLSCIIL